MAKCYQTYFAALLLLLCAGCSRRVVRTVASESVTAAAAASASAEASELRRLSELLTASLSTAAHVTDSVSVHTVERYTVDASGNVTGGTLERTTDRTRRASQGATSTEQREATTEAEAAKATAVASEQQHRVDGRQAEMREEESIPWWQGVAKAAAALLAMATAVAVGAFILRHHR